MLETVITIAVLLGSQTNPAPAVTVQAAPLDPVAKCEALDEEAAGLRARRNAASTRRVGGFLAGVAGRALSLAPSIELGDNPLARAAGQAVEGEAHARARSGLQSVQERGTSATPASPAERLRDIDAERADIGCGTS